MNNPFESKLDLSYNPIQVFLFTFFLDLVSDSTFVLHPFSSFLYPVSVSELSADLQRVFTVAREWVTVGKGEPYGLVGNSNVMTAGQGGAAQYGRQASHDRTLTE